MKKTEVLKLENQICFRLYTASRFMTQLYSPILEDLDLTYPQYLVMLVLWEHTELSVKDIGSLLYLDSGTLTPLLKKLESKNLVKRIRSKDDERIVNISITTKAQDLYEKAKSVPEKIMCKSGMEIDKIIELKGILDVLIENTLKITK
jgi:DNA-binding MarR family transcriptional regulator